MGHYVRQIYTSEGNTVDTLESDIVNFVDRTKAPEYAQYEGLQVSGKYQLFSIRYTGTVAYNFEILGGQTKTDLQVVGTINVWGVQGNERFILIPVHCWPFMKIRKSEAGNISNVRISILFTPSDPR